MPIVPDRVRWAVGVLDPQPGGRVLDVGSGTGASVDAVLQRVGATDAAGLPCIVNTTLRMHAVRSRHPSGANVALGDASVRFVRNSINPMAWLWSGSITDGQVTNLDS